MAWSKKHLEVWSKGAKRKQERSRTGYKLRMMARQEALALSRRRIEAIIGELESLDRQTNGIYRDTYDWEPLSIVNRLLLKSNRASSSGPRSRGS